MQQKFHKRWAQRWKANAPNGIALCESLRGLAKRRHCKQFFLIKWGGKEVLIFCLNREIWSDRGKSPWRTAAKFKPRRCFPFRSCMTSVNLRGHQASSSVLFKVSQGIVDIVDGVRTQRRSNAIKVIILEKQNALGVFSRAYSRQRAPHFVRDSRKKKNWSLIRVGEQR